MAIFRLTKIDHILDGRRVASGTPGAKMVKRRSRKFYGQLPGSEKRIPLAANRAIANKMYAQLLADDEGKQAGLVSRRPLTEHVEDFRQYLQDRGNSPKHVRQTATRVLAILDGCKFSYWAELRPSIVTGWLAKERKADRLVVAP